ncbi:spore protein, partial [Bacillus spizizenii]|nr:spore protein [Bacillus spizizenii]
MQTILVRRCRMKTRPKKAGQQKKTESKA